MNTKTHRNIAYSVSSAAQIGDLFLPETPVTAWLPPVLLIHGGGWNGLAKENFEFILPYFLRSSRPVFNINYRLISESFWPACGDDCLAAAHFMLGGGLESYGVNTPEHLLICGASAGGHLAMHTGIHLPRAQVEGILSMAGPGRVDWIAEGCDPLKLHEDFYLRFFGSDKPSSHQIESACPSLSCPDNPPPLFCIHSRGDQLVLPIQSETAASVWAQRGGISVFSLFNGTDNLHGFWINNDRAKARLRPDVAACLNSALLYFGTTSNPGEMA